jgi:predicted nuclease of restriction endonuclease-like (RecB) superfamily
MNYDALITTLAQVHQQAQAGAAGAVNRHLILRNWLIGAYLVEYEQHGEDRAQYGQELLPRLAKDLAAEGVPGCSREMLGRMRLLFRLYPQLEPVIRSSPMTESLVALNAPVPIRSAAMTDSRGLAPNPPCQAQSAELVLRLSWTHLIELVRIDDPWKRAFFENECLRGNWSVRQLQRQIGSLLYERTGLSTDKQAVINRGREQAAEAPGSMAEWIRDPYVLEFTGLAAKPEHHETDLEAAILDHLQAFLLELGTGVCFEARQKRITVGNEHDYLDLVFYHRRLRCHLLIDLKIRPFQHGDAGQMNFYLNYWKDREMAEGDSPPVGLILCTDRDKTRVEYATAGLDHQFFVSRYLVALPKPDDLKRLVETDLTHWQQTHALLNPSQAPP